MIFKVRYRLKEPIVNLDGNESREMITGEMLRGALVNLFLKRSCPHSSSWCNEKSCPDYSRCFVPTELLDLHSSFSFGQPECPNCKEDRLIPIPSTWLKCKQCMRYEGKSEFIKTEIGKGGNACPTCKSVASLKYFGGLYCLSCGNVVEDYPYTQDITNVGLNPNMRSSEASILFNYPVIIPGYTIIQYISTENPKFESFISAMPGQTIYIGGKRNRGFGACEIQSIEKIEDKVKYNSNQLCFATTTFVTDANIGGIERNEIKESNGSYSFTGHFKSSSPGQGRVSERLPVVIAGSVVKLTKDVELNLKDILFSFRSSNEDGYNSVIPLKLFNKEE